MYVWIGLDCLLMALYTFNANNKMECKPAGIHFFHFINIGGTDINRQERESEVKFAEYKLIINSKRCNN
ncbi:hypothetical protein T4D_11241 [Trichinella pseudospiralis]|uniref:Secreted protein n=1 Tax=Trichinella pseudospiralis TaxID=6337 RepID=A0A0V1FP17_TRIPS|nr:hypothetical protein T4D_11241 [Trichinella pseudospiralis]